MKQGLIFWFSGLSGVGKTTIANLVRKNLNTESFKVSVLDGDDVRDHQNRHLGFSKTDIKENNNIISRLCLRERELADIVLVPIISPYAESRARARKKLSPGFFEIHFFAEISVLESRDTKGLYVKARSGEMENLIGYSLNSPYEPPETPDLFIDTGNISVTEALGDLTDFILSQIAR
jgi:adenylyl-sulfate kinase